MTNNLRSVLFKNDRKESDSHPDYKGSAEVEGVEYWLAAWIKTARRSSCRRQITAAEEARNSPPPREPVRANAGSAARQSDWPGLL